METFLEHEPSCLIVGAGIAGLIAARELHRQGVRVLVLEKSRGVGGRMASRRFEQGVFDHGTQYFSPASAWFQSRIHEWTEEGIAREWFRCGHLEVDPRFISTARYRGHPSMTAIPKFLAVGVDVLTSEKVIHLHVEGNAWHAITEAGNRYSARACILTAPLPQCFELLDASELDREAECDALRDLRYDPCLTALALCAAAPDLPEDGVREFPDGPLLRIMDNHRKGISPDAHAVTIHASPEFSAAHIDADPSEWVEELLAHAAPVLGVEVLARQVHRWRYATVPHPHAEPCVSVHAMPPLLLAGDAFGEHGVEGAARSGMEAAQFVRQVFLRRRAW